VAEIARGSGDQLAPELRRIGAAFFQSLHEQLQTAGRPMLIDIREPELFSQGTLDGAVNIPLEELSRRAGELPEDREAPIVTLCGIGKFSKNAVLYLKSLGYRNVRSMKGGVNEWVRKGHELTGNGTP
jgi:rhodanese-related sulfurtransferase